MGGALLGERLVLAACPGMTLANAQTSVGRMPGVLRLVLWQGRIQYDEFGGWVLCSLSSGIRAVFVLEVRLWAWDLALLATHIRFSSSALFGCRCVFVIMAECLPLHFHRYVSAALVPLYQKERSWYFSTKKM